MCDVKVGSQAKKKLLTTAVVRLLIQFMGCPYYFKENNMYYLVPKSWVM